MRNNPNLDVVNINAYTKSGQIRSICSQDIERKQNSDIKHGPWRIIISTQILSTSMEMSQVMRKCVL